MNRKINNKKSAFTLAEILITLLVIGVISSLTIPTIIQNTQEAHLKTAWKKSYSDFAQVVEKMKIDRGGIIESGFLYTTYLPYLDYVKACTGSASPGVCWHDALEWSRLDGYLIQEAWAEHNKSAVMMKNGTLISFQASWGDCSYHIGTSNYYACNKVYIDVNGFKKPNIIGKDIFALWVLKDRILPMGIPGDVSPVFTMCIQPPNSGWTSPNNQGVGCSAGALMD